MGLVLHCINCIHYTGKGKCEAFPKGIPASIRKGTDEHTEPVKGQGNKIVFEPIKADI